MNIIQIVGSISFISFLLALYIFGYTLTYIWTSFTSTLRDSDGNQVKDYSISFSLANGGHIEMTVFFTIGLFSLMYLLYLKFYRLHLKKIKGEKNLEIIYYVCNILLLTIYSLIISMIFYSPYTDQAKDFNDKIKDEHYAVAVVAFTCNLIFAILIAFLMLYRGKLKVAFYIVIAIEIGFFLSLLADVGYEDYIKKSNDNTTDTYFPVAENINYQFMIYLRHLVQNE